MSKLLEIQSELKVGKDQLNEFGGFRYRSCEDILEAIKPLLEKHELTLSLSDELVLVGDWHYIKATATLTGDGEPIIVSAFAREQEKKTGMDTAQVTGSTSSYARKYALNGLFLIDDAKDADAQKPEKPAPKPKAKPTKKEPDEPPHTWEPTDRTAKLRTIHAIWHVELELHENTLKAYNSFAFGVDSSSKMTDEDVEELLVLSRKMATDKTVLKNVLKSIEEPGK